MTLGGNLAAGLVFTAGWHGYLWLRLVHGPALRPPFRAIATLALAAGTILIPVTLSHPPAADTTAGRIQAILAFGWMGLALLLLAATLATEPIRFAAWLRAGREPDRARRTALGRVLGLGAAALGAGGAVAGAREALDLVIARVRVPLAKLPPSMSGTRIVQITDLHLGATIRRAYLEAVVAQVNSLDPDIVAITGDLVDGPVDALRDTVEPLRDLRARHGVFFVTGNHEYYHGAPEWIAHLRSLGLRVLENERVSIGGPDGSFDLAGVHDLNADAYRIGLEHAPDKALRGRDRSREVVLLAHQPSSIYAASRLGVGLQISGHTHGGQLFPYKYLVHLTHPFVEGLHRMGETWIFVSRGTGYWGPPMRLGARPEIVEITLERYS